MAHRGLRLWLALAALLLGGLLGILLGAGPLDWREAGLALQSAEITPAFRILWYVRIPRVAGAALAGAGLAVAGAVIQGVLGNPLASPNVIGVNAGAGLSVLLVSALLPSMPSLRVPAAFAGALAGALIVFALTAHSAFTPLAVVLSGFAVSSVFNAGMNAVLLIAPDAYVGSGSFLAGGLSGLTLPALAQPAVYLSVGLLAAILLSPALNILSLGGDAAAALGMRVPLCRILLLVVAAMLAGAAVSFAGMVGFVGLVAPHAARFLVGQDNRYVVPFSALSGAAFVVVCDLLARVAFAPYELPVGILLSLIGGPFFIYLILYNRGNLRD